MSTETKEKTGKETGYVQGTYCINRENPTLFEVAEELKITKNKITFLRDIFSSENEQLLKEHKRVIGLTLQEVAGSISHCCTALKQLSLESKQEAISEKTHPKQLRQCHERLFNIIINDLNSPECDACNEAFLSFVDIDKNLPRKTKAIAGQKNKCFRRRHSDS